MNNRCLIIPDPHLGKASSQGKAGIGGQLNSRTIDQSNLLDWCLDQAIEKLVYDIIVAGDIFEDPKPHPVLITLFMSWLKKCQVHGIRVHIILGNHDLLRSGTSMMSALDIISEADLDGITVYKNISTIYLGSTAITLIPFRDRKSFGTAFNIDAMGLLRHSLQYELAGIPLTYNKIIVGHLAIEGALWVGDEIDDIANELFCPLDMFTGYDYVWMGHIHNFQVLQKTNPHISHIGSMDISNFGETEQEKKIVIFDCENNSFTTEILPTRPLRKITISIPKNTENTTQFVLDEIKKSKTDFSKSIVKLEVSLASTDLKSVEKSEIEKFLIEQGAFNITGISEQKKVSLIKKDINNNIDTKMDVSSAIKSYAKTYIEEEKRDVFTELSMDVYAQYKLEIKETSK